MHLYYPLVFGACLEHEAVSNVGGVVDWQPHGKNELNHRYRIDRQVPEVPGKKKRKKAVKILAATTTNTTTANSNSNKRNKEVGVR